MEYIVEYIKPELLILVSVLYLIGVGLKKSQTIRDSRIPLILGAIGILLSAMYVFATSAFSGVRDILMGSFVAVTQGVLCAGVSVYVNQIIKQQHKD